MENEKADVASSINPESPCRYCGKAADICFRLDPSMVATVPLTTAGSAMILAMDLPPKEPGEVYICVGCLDEKVQPRGDNLFFMPVPKPGVS